MPGLLAPLRRRAEGRALPGSDRGWARSGAVQAGVLFAAVGLLGIVSDLVPGASYSGRLEPILIDGATAAVGLATLALPWRRWPPRASMCMAAFALLLYFVNDARGFVQPAASGIYLVLIMGWVGYWHGVRWALAATPVAAAAYLVPFTLGPHPGSSPGSAVVVLPFAVLTGVMTGRSAVLISRANATLVEASITDELTGLRNRRHATRLLASLGPGDTLVLLDLDHFKAVNDRHGHVRGDLLLQELGRYLCTAVRDEDLLARVGGEEFILVLRGVEDPVPALDRLLGGWRQRSPLTTFSAGAVRHRSGATPESTYMEADLELYAAKRAGRDRFRLAPDGDAAPHGDLALDA